MYNIKIRSAMIKSARSKNMKLNNDVVEILKDKLNNLYGECGDGFCTMDIIEFLKHLKADFWTVEDIFVIIQLYEQSSAKELKSFIEGYIKGFGSLYL